MPDEANAGARAFRELTLEVNGREIRLNRFVKQMLGNVIVAAVAALKGGEDAARIVIRVER